MRHQRHATDLRRCRHGGAHAPERRGQRGGADAGGRRAAHRGRHVLCLGGHLGAGRHPPHRDGPPDLRRARRPSVAAARMAPRGVPPRRIPGDAQHRHHAGHLDEVRPPVGVERHDRRRPQPSRRRPRRPRVVAHVEGGLAEGMAVAHAKGIRVPQTTVADVAAAYSVLPPGTSRRCSRTSSAGAVSSCRG